MLIIQNTSKKILKKWKGSTHTQQVIFTTHCTELLNYYEDEFSLSIFYGFLDQDYSNHNPAQFISEQILALGIDCLNQLFGSFILIHLNKKTQQYLIANDALGDFAVHYYRHKNTIHLSDFPQALLNKNNLNLNNKRLLHYFAQSRPQNNGCFFIEISQLNPGHCLIIESDKIHIKRYYFPRLSFDYKTPSIDELSEQFKLLMQNVIKFQCKGHEKIGIMMSGGLDSTFVAANALKANKQVNTYSYVFPNIPEANESTWIDSMRNCGFNMHTFVGEKYWPLKPPWHVSLNSPLNNPYRHLKTVIYQQAQSQGIKTILTGVFADHLYIGYIYWLVDQLKHNIFSASKSFIKVLKTKGIVTGLRQISPNKFTRKIKAYSPWMTPEAQREIEKLKINFVSNQHPHPQQFDLVYGLSTAQSAFLENEYAFKHDMYTRHPFRDRRIVEFLMAMPAWVLGDIHNPKKFVRHTAKNLLPDNIIRRKKITSLQPLFNIGVLTKELPKIKEILTDPYCQWQQYVKKDLIIKLINNPNNNHKDSDLFALWQSINFELWRSRLNDSF